MCYTMKVLISNGRFLFGGIIMSVSYKKLWMVLAEKEMSRAEFREEAEIAPNTMTKLGKNEYVAMSILDKICKTLGTDYGDIMEYIPENEKNATKKTVQKII